MGGNMVVNFGPQPDGDFRHEEKELAEAVGRWMKKNGECVYGCDYAGLEKQDWGYYTRNGNDIYMVVFNLPFSKWLTVKTPKELKPVEAVTLDGQKVEVVETTNNEYNVKVPEKIIGDPFVIKLKVEIVNGSVDKYRAALT